jgi:hypothetical protein
LPLRNWAGTIVGATFAQPEAMLSLALDALQDQVYRLDRDS